MFTRTSRVILSETKYLALGRRGMIASVAMPMRDEHWFATKRTLVLTRSVLQHH